MNSNPRPSDLDAALNSLEQDTIGASLRTIGDEITMPAPTAQRLQSRMHVIVSTQSAHTSGSPITCWLQCWTTIPRLPRFAATLSVILILVMATVMISVSIRPTVASAAELLEKAQKRTETVVDAGQVRHIVREVSMHNDQGVQQFITEIWITQGDGHLMTSWRIRSRDSEDAPYVESLYQVIGQDTTSTYDDATNTVYQGPFDPCALDLAQWIGSKDNFEQMKADPNAKIVGTETINGIQTVIVEVWNQRVWIAPDSGLFVQSESIDKTANFVTTDKLTIDETVTREATPQDLFTFTQPKGSKLIKLDRLCSNG